LRAPRYANRSERLIRVGQLEGEVDTRSEKLAAILARDQPIVEAHGAK
jgi:hypothetical protein